MNSNSAVSFNIGILFGLIIGFMLGRRPKKESKRRLIFSTDLFDTTMFDEDDEWEHLT